MRHDKNINIHIVVTGWNCEQNVYRCMCSFVNQTVQKFSAVFISDGSTDRTKEEIIKHIPNNKRYSYAIYSENLFAAYRRYEAIKNLKCDDEDVILTVDMDDYLHPRALEIILEQYKNGVWMTYGNWERQNKDINPMSLFYTEEEIKNRAFRRLPYICVSPNSFKKKLWNKIPQSDYIINGEWLKVCTETGFRWSCLEMCGMDRVGIIQEPIYTYTWRPDSSLLRFGVGYKEKIKKEILKQKKKELYENQPILHVG